MTRPPMARAPRVSLRLDFTRGRLGPGKVELLEAIARERSIAAAARSLGMSYKRAWALIDAMNRLFREPVVATVPGRNVAGASELTVFGRRLVARYRAVERQAQNAADAAFSSRRRAERAARALRRPKPAARR